MTPVKTDPIADGETMLTWLNLALDTDFDMLSEDDLYEMPDAQVRAILERHGGPGTARSALGEEDGSRQQDASAPLAWRGRDDNAWIVRRPGLCRDVLDSMARETVTVLAGPVGRGRSTFWRQELRYDPDFRARYWPHVYLDCCALRSQNVERFEEEALRTQIPDDDDCRRFVSGLGDRASRPFMAWLAERLYRDAGAVVLDHAECLALRESGEMVNHMRALVAFCHERCIRLLILWSGPFCPAARRAFRRPATREDKAVEPSVILAPLIGSQDVGDWWNRPIFAPCRQAGLDASRVHAMTGGVPRLVRDFGRYVEDRLAAGCDPGIAMAEEFECAMPREYAPEIERAIRVARRRPILLEHPVRAARLGLGEEMVATGAFTEGEDGMLDFVSPILRRRFENCVQRRGLQTILHRGTITETLARRQFQEIGATDLADLLFRLAPNDVFKALDTILRSVCEAHGIERLIASVAHRDPMKERLWSDGRSLKARDPETWVLCAERHPDMAKAVRTARPVEGADGRLVVPVVTGRGQVGVVLTLDMAAVPDHPSLPRFHRRLLLRALWRMVLTLRPAIAQAMRNYDAHRERRAYRHALYRCETPHTVQGLLSRFGCQAALRMRRTSLGWIVETLDAIPREGAEGFVVEAARFERNDTGRLDAIGDYDAERHLPAGLVLEPPALRSIFADVVWRDDARAFVIRGVARDRLHLYLFAGRDAHRIDGLRQAELTRFTWERDLFAVHG